MSVLSQAILALLALLLGGTAAFGTTILGVVAIGQIKRSRGRLYGMPLAVFDALVFPLLLLDMVVMTFSLVASKSFFEHVSLDGGPGPFVLFCDGLHRRASLLAAARHGRDRGHRRHGNGHPLLASDRSARNGEGGTGGQGRLESVRDAGDNGWLLA